MLKSVLNRCGKFLTEIDLDGVRWEVTREIIDLIKKCPNLQNIVLGEHDINEDIMEAIMPIFDRVRKCDFLIKSMYKSQYNAVLKDLFLRNKKLEHLKIKVNSSNLSKIINKDFIDALPTETLKSLHLYQTYMPFNSICRVSILWHLTLQIYTILTFVTMSFLSSFLYNRQFKILKIFKVYT